MSTHTDLTVLLQAAEGKTKADLVIRNVRVLNVFTEEFETADVAVTGGVIAGIGSYEGTEEVDGTGKTLVPGFIDGHVHLESSIVSPAQYAAAVVPHGTTAVVADPHEITNVLGEVGFRYMMEASRDLPLDVYFMVPSCVPATPFDESGAEVTAADVAAWLTLPRVLGLAEMMNYPGVLSCLPPVLDKLEAAASHGAVIDGHAPGLTGRELNAYVAAGVKSDHECTTAAEAMEKISRGQWIMIREGTAGKNLDALLPLFQKPYADRCLLVTDDRDPGDLLTEGHIDHIIRRAIAAGASPVLAYKMASFGAATYFGLARKGAIAPGYDADFVLLDDIDTVAIHGVYKNGRRVDHIPVATAQAANPYAQQVQGTVRMKDMTAADFALRKPQEKVIGLVPGQILTTDEEEATGIDIRRDICKLAVLERHKGTGHMGVAFVKGYGLREGAVATSVAHDSHNIIVAGVSEVDMATAVNHLKVLGGGMVVVRGGQVLAELALPIAGLMCDLDVAACRDALMAVKAAAYTLGVGTHIDPFMTLSFASLAVIPTLRLTTLGVVDVTRFTLLD